MDQVPSCGRLYISGLDALNQPDLLDEKGITHILSILEFDYCDYEEFNKYQRLLIKAEDRTHENLLRHLEATTAFISNALAANGVVLVHCAMGQSRSATVVCAFMMSSLKLSARQALEGLREARPMCAPNEGFMEQLRVFERIGQVGEEAEGTEIYLAWERLRCGRKRAREEQ